jgi:hypothetical protein
MWSGLVKIYLTIVQATVDAYIAKNPRSILDVYVDQDGSGASLGLGLIVCLLWSLGSSLYKVLKQVSSLILQENVSCAPGHWILQLHRVGYSHTMCTQRAWWHLRNAHLYLLVHLQRYHAKGLNSSTRSSCPKSILMCYVSVLFTTAVQAAPFPHVLAPMWLDLAEPYRRRRDHLLHPPESSPGRQDLTHASTAWSHNIAFF